MKSHYLIFLLFLMFSIANIECQDTILYESLSISGVGNISSEYIGLIVYNNTTNMSIINITSEGLRL